MISVIGDLARELLISKRVFNFSLLDLLDLSTNTFLLGQLETGIPVFKKETQSSVRLLTIIWFRGAKR